MSLQETYPAFKRSNDRTELFEQMHESQNWASIEHDGWHLPAIDEPKDDCGKWMTKGCLDHKKHHGEYEGKVFIKTFQKSCYRASCQICYKKWMARESNKATRRIETYEKLSKKPVKHIIVSPPSWCHWNSRGFAFRWDQIRKPGFRISPFKDHRKGANQWRQVIEKR